LDACLNPDDQLVYTQKYFKKDILEKYSVFSKSKRKNTGSVLVLDGGGTIVVL
jgi:hypothetical protein